MPEDLAPDTISTDSSSLSADGLAHAGPPGYELLGVVGRGGMGVVYRARDLVLDREVAVKLLGESYAPDCGASRRFVDEARITGQLQHPGIPAVYQVGALADGRPFLAMKLIKGQTLDALQKAGAAVDVLSVFAAISQAVGYAHAHGVIHRDLKPANVMVGSFGEVQVMDWGLAKVLTGVVADPRVPECDQRRLESDPEATTVATLILGRRDAETPFTRHGSVLGTPAYMAPEQAAGELAKVGTRADVFGLGAILCVLLTGKSPYEGNNAEDVRLAAVRGDTAAALARLDGCEADPEVIALCKRCLAFDPAGRPATADAVATEVAALRRAADERVRQAERDKLAAEVRAAEQAKRRATILRAAGAVAAVLLVGVAGTSIGLYRADAARRVAQAAEQATELKRLEAVAAREAEAKEKLRAQAKEAEANSVVSFFEEQVFSAVRPKGQQGGQDKDVSLYEAIVASLPMLANAFPDQPLVQARLRKTLGNTFHFLGRAEAAAEQYSQAREIYLAQHGLDHQDTLRSMAGLASCYTDMGRHADALKLHEETLALQKRVLPADHEDTLRSMQNVAISYRDLGRHADALKLNEETLATRMRLLLTDHPDTLAVMNNLANNYTDLGRSADAIKLQEETLTAQKRVLTADHPDTLKTMNNLANSYKALDRHADALKLRQETIAAQKRVLPADHPDTLTSMNNLAISYAALGQHNEALKGFEETLAARQRALPADHPDTLVTMQNLANTYADLGRHDDALKLNEQTLAIRKRLLHADHPDTLAVMSNLANNYTALGRSADALKLGEETLAAQKRVLPADHPHTLKGMNNLANTYAALGRHDDALKLREETLAAWKRVVPADHPDTLSSMNNLANSYAALGRHNDALKLREETLAARKRVLSADHSETLRSMLGVAASLIKLDRGSEAVPIIDEFVTRATGRPGHHQMIPVLMDLRLRYFQNASDAAGCRAAAIVWEKLNRPDADSLYKAACFRAVTAAVQAKDLAVDAKQLAAQDADRALTWLAKAIAAGYKNRADMEKTGIWTPCANGTISRSYWPPCRRSLGRRSSVEGMHARVREHEYTTVRFECQNRHRPMLHLAIAQGYDIIGIRWDPDRGENLVIFEKTLDA